MEPIFATLVIMTIATGEMTAVLNDHGTPASDELSTVRVEGNEVAAPTPAPSLNAAARD
jgi:hypothetical protein